jgi:valyl-tRNA synthetase
MALSKRYNPVEVEQRLAAEWQRSGIYHFHPGEAGPVYSIDTPPPTVSGTLHLGHVYSYSHPDFMARFWRMNGHRVYYPMGYDDNGLPTERLVEKRLGISAIQVGRHAFIEKCLQISQEAEAEYQALWQRLGLSIDWRYTYRTIDENARRVSQRSFLDLYQKGLAYRKEAPAIWCPLCKTTIAQAELEDMDRESEFITLPFRTSDGDVAAIATTRPELLPACVAVFTHPADPRYRDLVGQKLIVPIFGQAVPVIEDSAADPQKGTGLVMCCTFGDTTDVAWWRRHNLPLIEALGRDSRMTHAAGEYAGLTPVRARQQIKQDLHEQGLLLERKATSQSVRVHERCDTPVEYVVAHQWFIRLLDDRQPLLEMGDQVAWFPDHMVSRYRAWVENLSWDWCISRQRYFGVPFPLWYCRDCGQIILADPDKLPVDPLDQYPTQPCDCGSTSFIPEEDILDTWATSSMTPQIVGQWLSEEKQLYQEVFPFSLRPQAHEIIRTWAFYTLVKSHDHFGKIPWKHVLISGWGLAGEGMGKISKSKGSSTLPPMAMIERYSADAVRYWAASTGPGKDSIISEEKIQFGARLVTKLWNVARFCEPFILESPAQSAPVDLNATGTPADRWVLSRLNRLVERVTALLQVYEYAAAKSEIEQFFWLVLADNYLEMCKQRLYTPEHPQRNGARYTVQQVLLTLLKLLAPFLPFVTEEIFLGLFDMNPAATGQMSVTSIHTSRWPGALPELDSERDESLGELLVEIASAVRRFKSEHNLSLGSEIALLQLATAEAQLAAHLSEAVPDLSSICRASRIVITTHLEPQLLDLALTGPIQVALAV